MGVVGSPSVWSNHQYFFCTQKSSEMHRQHTSPGCSLAAPLFMPGRTSGFLFNFTGLPHHPTSLCKSLLYCDLDPLEQAGVYVWSPAERRKQNPLFKAVVDSMGFWWAHRGVSKMKWRNRKSHQWEAHMHLGAEKGAHNKWTEPEWFGVERRCFGRERAVAVFILGTSIARNKQRRFKRMKWTPPSGKKLLRLDMKKLLRCRMDISIPCSTPLSGLIPMEGRLTPDSI